MKSLKASRHLGLREQVLQRQLHRFDCPSCQRRLIVDSDFFWFDFHRKQFIGVFPSGMRSEAERCESVLASTFAFTMKQQAPRMIQEYSRGFLVRTVFGVEELREKIVIHDAGLDDVVVEMVKIELLAAHPELLRRGVVCMRLDSFLDDGSLLMFPEAKDGTLLGTPPIGIGVKREICDAIVPHREELLKERSAIVSGSHVSMRRLADGLDAQDVRP